MNGCSRNPVQRISFPEWTRCDDQVKERSALCHTCRRVFLPSAIYMRAQSCGSRFAANWAFASCSASSRICLGSVNQKPTPACEHQERSLRRIVRNEAMSNLQQRAFCRKGSCLDHCCDAPFFGLMGVQWMNEYMNIWKLRCNCCASQVEKGISSVARTTLSEGLVT